MVRETASYVVGVVRLFQALPGSSAWYLVTHHNQSICICGCVAPTGDKINQSRFLVQGNDTSQESGIERICHQKRRQGPFLVVDRRELHPR
jgi:hypothetical protein